jgi:hypothetical protein
VGTPPSVASSAWTVLFPQVESGRADELLFTRTAGLSVASAPFGASALFVTFSLSVVPGRSTSSQGPAALLAMIVLDQGDHSLLRLVRPNSNRRVPPLRGDT